MSVGRMYDDLAELWPLVSPPEDYAEEAVHWRAALRARLGPADGEARHEILELGVGGGNNLSHLTDEFRATAVDLSEPMLAHSRRLNPGVEHHVGDMRSVRLGRTFDAVLIHDAVSYLVSEDELRATFATAAAHLRPGGVFVCAPDWYRESFPGRSVHLHDRGPQGRDFVMLEYARDKDPDDTVMEIVYVFLLWRNDRVAVEVDRHTLGLFPVATWVRLMDEAGFDVEKRPYPVHADGHEAYLLTGVIR